MSGLLERAAVASSGASRRWLVRRVLPACLAIAVLVWAIWFSSVLGVRSVKITGTHFVTDDQVAAVAAIVHGEPLARLDTSAVERRVERLLPVKTARVSTSYPSTVRISVVERVPVGVVSSDGQYWLVDAANVAFAKVRSPRANLPVLSDYGDDRSAAVATVAGDLPAPLLSKVGSIDAQSAQSVALHLRDGRTVVWGGTDRAGEKAQLMKALLSQPGTYFDLSDPDTVISRGAPAPSATN